MKKWRLAGVMAGVLALSMVFAGCSGGGSGKPAESKPAESGKPAESEAQADDGQKEKKVYGYITPGPDTWYQRNVEGFQMGAEKDGYDVVVLNSDYDVSKEVANIDSMINQGVDGLCIFSFNENGAKIAAEKCAAAGIPVVATDSVGTVLDSEKDVVAAVDFDWTEMGNTYAQWLADNCPDEKVVVLTGTFESVPCQRLNDALTKKVAELGKNEIVDIKETGYNPSQAINVAQDMIASGKEFSVFYVMNEDMAAGVIQMLDDKGLLGEYKVIAQNGSPAGLPLIKNGKLSYTISSSPGWEGLISYLVLDQYAAGRSDKTDQQIMLPIMPVTQENIDDKTKVVPWEVDDCYWDLTKEYFPELIAE